MAVDPRKRQKKLQRKTAKRKLKVKELALRNPTDLRSRLERASRAPVVHALISQPTLDDGNLGHVLLSREIHPGEFAVAVFLVDPWCLGVKNAFCDIRSREDMELLLERLWDDQPAVAVKPEYVRKFVEEAVSYARDLGFAPHPDYDRARGIFGDIDTGACSTTFTWGKDGKPFFVGGPHDSPARCQQIMNVLTTRLGDGGFGFSVLTDDELSPFDLDEVEMVE